MPSQCSICYSHVSVRILAHLRTLKHHSLLGQVAEDEAPGLPAADRDSELGAEAGAAGLNGADGLEGGL